MNENSVCNISLQSNDAKLLRKSALIISDEVMMSHVDQVDCVYRSLWDILKVDKPYIVNSEGMYTFLRIVGSDSANQTHNQDEIGP